MAETETRFGDLDVKELDTVCANAVVLSKIGKRMIVTALSTDEITEAVALIREIADNLEMFDQESV